MSKTTVNKCKWRNEQEINSFMPKKFNGKNALHLMLGELKNIYKNASPVLMQKYLVQKSTALRIRGTGVYFRLDYWAKMNSGGSYTHTCYVAKELAENCDSFLCCMANRYELLDEFGLEQIILGPASRYSSEDEVVKAPHYYYKLLTAVFKYIHPSFIYERYCLANYTAAKISQEFRIPYLLEYNGSEASLKRSFDTCPYEFEDYYHFQEQTLFQQATAIIVVSDIVKEELLNRRIPENKILVNPNGVDSSHYQPPPLEEKKRLRRELGFDDSHCVVGFIGSFGGWHGIGVLAKSLHPICRQNPTIRFLIIGDGNFKHLLDDEIKKHKLHNVITCPGRVSQNEGCRLLKICDIYVSPHDSHMVDSRFFGSPTKVFEYMAMQGGIVASELEQIGQVLSPAIRIRDINKKAVKITNQRSFLCKPGNLDEFVKGVLFLASHPEIRMALGKNARQAVIHEYSWKRNVEKVIEFIAQSHT